MRLYLVQHGESVSEEVNPERPLSEKGISDVKKLAQFLKDRKICIERVLHSTKLRAIQTAEILLREAGLNAKSEQCEGLAPNDPIDKMMGRIKSLSSTEKDRALMMVGHLPFLQKLSDKLLTSSETAGLIAFRQGGIVCLEEKQGVLDTQGKWQICWQMIPELLS